MAAWKIFSPLLTDIEEKAGAIKEGRPVANKYKPVVYPYGSRGPDEAEAFIKSTGMARTVGYTWSPPEDLK